MLFLYNKNRIIMKLRLHSISEGKHEVILTDNISEFPNITSEFTGDIKLEGILSKYKNRFSFKGNAICDAMLPCDYCLEEFKATICAEVIVNMLADTNIFFLQKQNHSSKDDEIVLHEDDVYYDIRDDVKDCLLLNLPMKRLCSNCKGKSFKEIFPHLSRKKA